MAARTRDTGYISAYPVIVGYAETYGVATGGTSSSITVSSQAYTLLTFTSDSNLVVSTAGLFDVLLIGGGGASIGIGDSNSGGGAGAGGVFQQTVYFEAGTWTVDVGAGGAGTDYSLRQPNNGRGSSIYNAVNKGVGVAGGGAGGGWAVINSITGGSSGGAGSLGVRAYVSNDGLTGNIGGTGTTGGGGGGGGAGAVGANGASGTGGAGGAGVDVSTFISGSALFKAGGGGGGGTSTAGAGGSGGGGAGGVGATTGTAGTANSGGGGGNSQVSGSGGSGIIYVRFKV